MENKDFRIHIDGVEYYSLRFYPFWRPDSSEQITGLMHLIYDIGKLGLDLKGVEIGSYIGESSLMFLSYPHIRRLICIDQAIQKLLLKRLSSFIDSGRCIPLEMLSSDAHDSISETDFDFIYIDGDHSYESVKNDIEMWYPRVRMGGILCGHDYNPAFEGVIRAVDEFVKKHASTLKIYEDSSWSVVKN